MAAVLKLREFSCLVTWQSAESTTATSAHKTIEILFSMT